MSQQDCREYSWSKPAKEWLTAATWKLYE